MPKTALLIGAGPAGLTAALEFLRRSDVHPIVLEASHEIGGISRTIRHNGNRIDIGGHRFFSKSDRVMNWWMDLMPPEASADTQHAFATRISSEPSRPTSQGLSPETTDLVMLVRPRKSRIYFLRRFFDYPIKLTADTLRKLGLIRTVKIGCQLPAGQAFSAQDGEVAGGFSHQPLRAPAVPDIFQVLHGEGLGRSLRGDQRRVGSTAHQGPVAHHRGSAFSQEAFSSSQGRGDPAEGNRDLAD